MSAGDNEIANPKKLANTRFDAHCPCEPAVDKKSWANVLAFMGFATGMSKWQSYRLTVRPKWSKEQHGRQHDLPSLMDNPKLDNSDLKKPIQADSYLCW